jgi:hypothetical protein
MLKNRLMTCPGHVRLVVHDPLPTTGLEASAASARHLAGQIRAIIRADVDEPGGDEIVPLLGVIAVEK